MEPHEDTRYALAGRGGWTQTLLATPGTCGMAGHTGHTGHTGHIRHEGHTWMATGHTGSHGYWPHGAHGVHTGTIYDDIKKINIIYIYIFILQ